ncbi:hypothetical protein [Flavobacterium branchiicola]|uniref:Uncharacterized protein n=1 Tax=Flavobacterium branchiicola TaxID=1114875 RepID=A0ABV9PAP8_9FLAO|nr:hypothetical protein [Flavobacterium branchiicola]MBS7252421.1 hypothetical protein [Flavobacterium branchiicola]
MTKLVPIRVIRGDLNKKTSQLGGLYKLYFTYLYNTSPLLLNCNNADNSDNNVTKVCHF